MAMEWIWILTATILAYLIGSISTAILVGRLIAGEDIRSHGSGNAGATNALRTYGKKAALLVLLGDVLKAVVAVGVAYLIRTLADVDEELWRPMLYLATLGAVLGHNFPVYFQFRGGKGVLVSTVSILFVDWRIGLLVIAIALLTMVIWRFVSLGSMLGAVSYLVLSLCFHWGDWLLLLQAVLLSGLLIYMHRTNIKRLLSGTESKLGQKKN
ncbi:MAG: glycerol-3-phosphate 1-O-acyltransferase PlsY [Clostridia bacterium]|nr:glycerol-3-phosphate 1-O-acyltransferase PlsY [Clostridia bacterium]